MSRTVLIADDHPLFRQALRLAVEGVMADAQIVEAGTLEDAERAALATDGLSLILLDLRMPGAIGCSGVALLHACRPATPILVVSSADPDGAFRAALDFGAVGYLGKDQPLHVMEQAIADAVAGHVATFTDSTNPRQDMAERIASLAPMQLRVLLGVIDGKLNKQIAHDLGINEATVKAHMTVVMRKLGVANRTQATAAMRAFGAGLDPIA